MSCDVDCRRGLGPPLLWLWHRPAAVARIPPLALEPPYAACATPRWQKTPLSPPKKRWRFWGNYFLQWLVYREQREMWFQKVFHDFKDTLNVSAWELIKRLILNQTVTLPSLERGATEETNTDRDSLSIMRHEQRSPLYTSKVYKRGQFDLMSAAHKEEETESWKKGNTGTSLNILGLGCYEALIRKCYNHSYAW